MVTIAEYYCITAKQDIVGIDGVAVVCEMFGGWGWQRGGHW
jgi:hypothetical protein